MRALHPARARRRRRGVARATRTVELASARRVRDPQVLHVTLANARVHEHGARPARTAAAELLDELLGRGAIAACLAAAGSGQPGLVDGARAFGGARRAARALDRPHALDEAAAAHVAAGELVEAAESARRCRLTAGRGVRASAGCGAARCRRAAAPRPTRSSAARSRSTARSARPRYVREAEALLAARASVRRRSGGTRRVSPPRSHSAIPPSSTGPGVEALVGEHARGHRRARAALADGHDRPAVAEVARAGRARAGTGCAGCRGCSRRRAPRARGRRAPRRRRRQRAGSSSSIATGSVASPPRSPTTYARELEEADRAQAARRPVGLLARRRVDDDALAPGGARSPPWSRTSSPETGTLIAPGQWPRGELGRRPHVEDGGARRVVELAAGRLARPTNGPRLSATIALHVRRPRRRAGACVRHELVLAALDEAQRRVEAALEADRGRGLRAHRGAAERAGDVAGEDLDAVAESTSRRRLS